MKKTGIKIKALKNNYYPDYVEYEISYIEFENNNSYKFVSDSLKELKGLIEDKFPNLTKEIINALNMWNKENFTSRLKKIEQLVTSIKDYQYHYYEEKITLTCILHDKFLQEVKKSNYLSVVLSDDVFYFYNFKIDTEFRSRLSILQKHYNLKKEAISLNKRLSGWVLLSEEAAAGLIHESLGHLLEEDYFSRDIFSYFSKENFFNKQLTIVDDSTIKSFGGSYQFDDEGYPAKKDILVENGKFIKLLGCKSYSHYSSPGNGRCTDYTQDIITRQSNFYIKAGKFRDNELFSMKDNFVYIIQTGAGSFKGLDFEIEIKLGILYKKETLQYFKDALIVGNSIDFLKHIHALGNKMQIFNIECIKMNQWFYDISAGSPKIMLKNINILPSNEEF